jgi:hypothetical protein
MAMHRLGKRVVPDACEWDRLSRVKLLHSWSGQRQNLDIDTGGVHVRDPALADIAELVDQPGKTGRHLRLRPDCFGLFLIWQPPGGPDELPRLVSLISSGKFPDAAPLLVRTLWQGRWKIGALLHWDSHDTGVGSRVDSLRDRLPEDLRAAPRGPDFAPFTSVYQLEHEWVAELANQTVHAIMHIGWVPDGSGGYHGQMAVLVKPNGPLGAAYMAAIKPFRHLIVYPALIRWIQHKWLTSGSQTPSSADGLPHDQSGHARDVL